MGKTGMMRSLTVLLAMSIGACTTPLGYWGVALKNPANSAGKNCAGLAIVRLSESEIDYMIAEKSPRYYEILKNNEVIKQCREDNR